MKENNSSIPISEKQRPLSPCGDRRSAIKRNCRRYASSINYPRGQRVRHGPNCPPLIERTARNNPPAANPPPFAVRTLPHAIPSSTRAISRRFKSIPLTFMVSKPSRVCASSLSLSTGNKIPRAPYAQRAQLPNLVWPRIVLALNGVLVPSLFSLLSFFLLHECFCL